MDKKNPEYGHFSRSESGGMKSFFLGELLLKTRRCSAKYEKHSCDIMKKTSFKYIFSRSTTAQKMKLSIKDFFSKCNQIHRKM